ncbi:MAG: hypothetical protein ACOX6Q_00130 [Candidatus Dojkabacteria bacterium]|jgi:adenylate kinase family enzyme
MKIYITGSAGSGKSTYAKKLSEKLKIPVYRTDDFYEEKEKRMFTGKEISEVVDIDSDWIIEGAYYIPKYVRAADKVIYIRIDILKTVFRIFKRWFSDVEIRRKFSLLDTIKLCFTTVRDRYTSEGIDVKTNIPRHYKEKDRYNLCKKNAKEFVELYF